MPIEIQFRYTRGDYAAMSLAVSRLTPLNRLYRFALAALAMLLLTTWAGQSGAPVSVVDELKSSFMFFVSGQLSWPVYTIDIAFLVLIAGRDYFTALFAMATFKQRATANEIHSVALGEDGIDYAAQNVSSHIAWPMIRQIIETRWYLFLMIDNRQAVAMPRRAFADAAAFGEALAFARAHAEGMPK